MSRARAIALAAFALACDGSASDDAGVDAFLPPDAGPPPSVVPAETADVAALARLADLASLPDVGAGARLVQQSSEERPDGGPVPIPLLENENRDMNHFVCLGDEADFRTPNLVDARFDLDRCPERYVRGAVMARFEGSGALVRLWMTLGSMRDRPADRERLLVYVDDAPEPLIDVPLRAVVDGTAGEIFAPPFGAAAASHVAWYYPVVFETKLVLALDGAGPFDLIYHQATVALHTTARRRASDALPERALAAAALEERPRGATTESGTATVPAGASADVLGLTGAGTIRTLAVAAADRPALDDVRLRVYWDGATDPAIDAPIRELFASAITPPSDDGPLLGPDGDGVALRLPMPFASGARFEVANDGASDVDVTLEATVDADAPASGRLHVERHETVGPTTATHHPLASVTGAGRLAGVCLMMEGHALPDGGSFGGPLNFLEGDERIVADGEALTGTGTEDYLDGAFYFEHGPHATPFTQAWVAPPSGDTGRATGCRWHVRTNAVDFAVSLEAELEIGPGTPEVLDRYRSVAFLYR